MSFRNAFAALLVFGAVLFVLADNMVEGVIMACAALLTYEPGTMEND